MHIFRVLSFVAIVLTLAFSQKAFGQCTANAGQDTSICLGASAQIGGLPAGTGTGALTYSWSPATGLNDPNIANPVVTPTVNQVYTLTVTATGGGGCTATDQISVTVDPVPVANFTITGNNNCSNVAVQFTNTSTGTGLTYSWNFGDPSSGAQNTSTLLNPTHAFVTYGAGTQTYNVTLVVTNAQGCTHSITQTVTIRRIPNPTLIDPIADMRNCDGTNFNMTVFDASATTSVSNYTIQWGDGSPNFSSGTFPGAGVSHTYSSAQIFNLYYIITGTNGCVDSTVYNIANITNPAIGAANPGATTGCGPLTLCFPLSNYSANHSTTYYVVNYGDGSPQDTLPHPPPTEICHTYTTTSCGQPGNAFTFRIKAINLCDSSFASISPIRIYTGPQAHFNVVPGSACVNSNVLFQNTTVTGYNTSCSGNAIYQWNFGDGNTLTTATLTSPTHPYSAPGTYTVSLTVTNSCGSTTETHTVCIEAPPVPSFTLSPNAGCVPFVTTCTDASTLTNTCAVTRTWSVIFNGSLCVPGTGQFQFVGGTNANSVNPQIQFTNPGNYTVRLTLTNSCGSFIYDQAVTAQKAPEISINALASICANTSASPVGNVNSCLESVDSYAWTFTGGTPSSASTLSPGTITYTSAGTYPVQFSATNACGTTTTTTNIVIKPLPPVLNAAVNTPICVGQTANFTSDPLVGGTYSWTNPSSTVVSTNQNFSIANATLAQAGNYTVTGTLNGCVGPPSTVNLVVNPIPVVSVTPPSATICNGSSVNLTASGATTYTWSPATGLNTTIGATVTANPTSTQTYTVTGANGTCSGTANVTITVNPLPVVNAGPDTTVCDQPIAFQLGASPAGGTWSGPNVTAGGQFTPSGAGSFTVTYSFTNANGCTNTDSRIVTVVSPTPAVAGPDFQSCLGSANVTLNGAPVGGTWTGTGVTSGGVFTPNTLGTYNLVYNFGTGSCLTRDTLVATVVPLPVVDAGPNFTICIDAGIQNLTGTPGGGTWTGAGITNPGGQFTPSSAGAGTFTLTYAYTDGATGCSNTDVLTAIVNPLPVVNAGIDTTVCNQPVPFQVWSTPTGGTWAGTDITAGGIFTPNGTGAFTVTYSFTNANGCTNSDSRVITVVNPVVPNAGADFSVCINAPNVTLTPNPAGGSWTGPNVTTGGIYDPTTVGTETLVYTLGSGACLQRDTLLVTVNPLPVVNAGADITNCISVPSVNLSGTPAGGTWTGTGITNPSGVFSPPTSGAGTFNLTYTYTEPATGCSASDVMVSIVNPLPVVNAGNDTTLCDQPFPVQFTGTPAGGTWSGTNVTSAGVFTPNGTGTFTLTYTFTNGNGCTNTDTRVVTVQAPIQPNAGADFQVCIDGANVTLAPTPTGGTWTGSGVTSGGIFDPTVAGTFNLVYSYGAGNCLLRDTLAVTVNPLPVVDAGPNFTVCIDAGIQNLNGTPAGGTWTGTGISNSSGQFNPATSGAGTFTLTYTYTNPATGCTSSDFLSATVNPLPLVNAGVDTTLCNQPLPVQFNGTPSGGTWSGVNVTPTGVFTPTGTGSFTLTYTITSGAGCVNSDSRVVTVVNPVPSNAGPDQSACIDAPNVTLNGTPASGTWSGTDVTSGGIFNPTTAGTFTLVLSNGAGNCLMRDTMLFTVNPLPIVNAGPNADFCPSDAAVNFNGTPVGGTWSGTGITNAALGTFDPAVAPVGNHNIVYTFTNPATGCLNRDTLVAMVHPFPTANFTYNPIVCIGVMETFTNTSTLGNSYAWTFGDGGSSSAVSPTHAYAAQGFYDIEVVVSSAFGCLDSITHQVEVRIPPVADFSLTPDSACAPVLVSFTDLSTGPSLTYNWNYGNGNTSSGAVPVSQTYNQGVIADSTYTITLQLTNFCGTSTHQETVVAMPSPTAIFGTNTDVACSPVDLQIVNNSLGLPDTYYWDFGDGSPTSNSSAATLTHQFTTGTNDTIYTITLAVTNECGTDTAQYNIHVMPNQVNAFFNTSVTSGCVPLTVDFTQFSQGATISHWDFGDGNVSNAYSPSHTFATAGTFTVQLFANDGCGYDTTTVQITVFPSPTVAFSSSPDSVCINDLFTFQNQSVGLASNTWYFGDGDSSLLTNPTHAYTTSGTYVVTLVGVSQTNGCTASVSHPIVVSTNPVAAFTPVPNSGCVPLTVSFQNNSTNSNFQAWSFGDGNFSSTVSPIHTYTSSGTFTVTLYVENANGCYDSLQQTVTVYPLPVADFTFVTSNPCTQPLDVVFTNNTTGAVNYQWNFGDGQTSALTNPIHQYAADGQFTIELIASNIYGCTDTATAVIDSYLQAVASFTLPNDSLCVNEPATFVSTSTNAIDLSWDFGDGSILTGSPVDYSFGGSGTFPITLIAYGEGGCNDTITVNQPIVVMPTPVAGFTFVNVQSPDPLSGTVEFTNTSVDADYYYWEFGNGNSSTEVDPTERYNQFGEFDVMLIATSEFGCVDTAYQTVAVDFFYGLFIPNAMSPGHNEFEVANFIPKGVGLKTFELLIYDDWGNLIWSTTALDSDGRPTEYWDGTYMGQPVQQDAYVWKCTATFMNEKVWEGKEYNNGVFKRAGTVTVIR